MNRSTFVAALAVIGAFAAGEVPAYACSPAPPFQVAILQNGLPPCVALDTFGPAISFINNCDQDLEVEVAMCDHCTGAPIELPAGSPRGGSVNLESRKQEGVTTSQALRWYLGDAAGTLETSVTFRDTSHDCDDLAGRRGGFPKCSIALHPGRIDASWILAIVLLGPLCRRRGQ